MVVCKPRGDCATSAHAAWQWERGLILLRTRQGSTRDPFLRLTLRAADALCYHVDGPVIFLHYPINQDEYPLQRGPIARVNVGGQ
jgi:hypothetical protein